MAVQERYLEREDSLFIEITGLTTEHDVFFDLVEVGQSPRILSGSNSRLSFQFTVDNNVTSIERQVYNSFMLLGDVGGLQGFLVSLSAILVKIFTFNNAENWLVNTLYSRDTKD